MQALQVADRVFGCTPNANGLRTLECCAGGMQALKAADRVFGSTPNAKGFRVLNGCGVIQSDGIDINAIRKVGGAA
jgi:3-hydroxy-3-methylglutaryl CoA synthase